MTDLELLRRFEPVLRFNEVELFLPASVDAYVRACSLWERQPDGEAVKVADVGELDLDALARIGRERRSRAMHLRYVQEPLSRKEFRAWRQAGHGAPMPDSSRFAEVGVLGRIVDALFRLTFLFRGTVPRGAVAAGEITYRESIAGAGTPYYGRVVREAGWTVLQYWFFYPMNDWRSSFHGINDHEADWEMVMLYLSPGADGDLAPRWVAFSSHDAEGDALRRRADDPDLEWIGEHVVAYPGAGSHSHTPNAMEELVRVDPPVLKKPLRFMRRVGHWLTPWAEKPSLDQGFGIPFVDYHRGDGPVVGPGGDHEWDPVLIDDDTPWVLHFRGRWGLDTGDPFGGESAPTGPRHERDGIDRVRWEDPLGYGGMQKVDPRPDAAHQAFAARHAEVVRRIAEIDAQVEEDRLAARREALEVMSLQSDTVTLKVAAERRSEAAAREAAMLAARAERRVLDAERRTLEDSLASPVPDAGPRAHLGGSPVPVVPDDPDAVPESRTRKRVLRIWAAISTPLLIAIIVWLLIGSASAYYGFGVIVGVLLVGGMESFARGRLLAFLATVAAIVVVAAIVFGMFQYWRLTLAVLLLIGGVILLTQNLRELRSR